MFNAEKINEISRKIKDIVSDSPLSDVEKNAHALLKSLIAKMDLVSREEFDVQAKILSHTREKLSELEARLTELERLQKPRS